MLPGKYRNHIGSDLVCRVSVRRNSICTNDDCIYFATLHNVSRHVISDYGDGNVVFGELPCGQSQSLKEWPGFVGNHGYALSRINRATNNAKSRPVVAGCSESTRI